MKMKMKMNGIPKDLKSFVIKKFNSRTQANCRILVVRTTDGVVAVASLFRDLPTLLRDFPIPTNQTELPDSVWRTTQLDLAIWYARRLARHGEVPSVRKERSRRKRVWKKAVERYRAHQVVKDAVPSAGFPIHQKVLVKPKPNSAYILIYNPKAETTFHVHTALCTRLDQERKRAVKSNGETWVVEARTAKAARDLQLAEFREDDKGYEESDFEIHSCGYEKED